MYIGGDFTTSAPLPRSVAGCYDLPARIDERDLARLAPIYPVPSRLPSHTTGLPEAELFTAATGSRAAGEPFLGYLRRGWDRPGPERGVLVVRPEIAGGEASGQAPASVAVAAGRRRTIRDDREKEVVEERLGEIQAEIRALSAREQTPALRGAVAGLWHLAGEVEEDLELYGRLVAGEVTLFGTQDLRELGEALVKARLSRGISLEELAAAVGLDQDELARHDREGYQKAPMWLLDGVVCALTEEIDVSSDYNRPGHPYPAKRSVRAGR